MNLAFLHFVALFYRHKTSGIEYITNLILNLFKEIEKANEENAGSFPPKIQSAKYNPRLAWKSRYWLQCRKVLQNKFLLPRYFLCSNSQMYDLLFLNPYISRILKLSDLTVNINTCKVQNLAAQYWHLFIGVWQPDTRQIRCVSTTIPQQILISYKKN